MSSQSNDSMISLVEHKKSSGNHERHQWPSGGLGELALNRLPMPETEWVVETSAEELKMKAMLDLQYRILEQAIAEQTIREIHFNNKFSDPALRRLIKNLRSTGSSCAEIILGNFRLVENAWVLLAKISGQRTELDIEERLLLRALAFSPSHRISRRDIQAVFAVHQRDDAPKRLDRVVLNLRGRMRVLGEQLPLKTVGGGYQFAASGHR